MSMKSIKIKNVMAFQNQDKTDIDAAKDINRKDSFELHFSDGINVLIGENGTGKTTILKMLYAASQWSPEKDKFHKYFSDHFDDSSLLRNTADRDSSFEVSDGNHVFFYRLFDQENAASAQQNGIPVPSVFIPTTEMLSHSKGFLALNEKFKMPFDGTQVDIIVNASLPEARKVPDYMGRILEQISRIIDGTVIQENDIFYVLKKDGRKIDFSLEAEGVRKLALLWKLIRNGLLESGTILFWDEPEVNLNPELFSLAAEILLELQNNGIQIFIATHSYNFAKYLELHRTDKKQVQFHTLTKQENGCISSASSFLMEELPENPLIHADDELLDMVYEDKVSGS